LGRIPGFLEASLKPQEGEVWEKGPFGVGPKNWPQEGKKPGVLKLGGKNSGENVF